MIIDIHTHVVAREFIRICQESGGSLGLQLEITLAGELYVTDHERRFGPMPPQVYDVERRFADMDALGVDMQVLSPPPVTFLYEPDADKTLRVARLQNDTIADLVAAYPTRFIGMGVVPLQDTALAIAEMERCVRDLGFHSLHIASAVRGKGLDHPSLRPFFRAAAELGVLLLIHPKNVPAPDRLQDFYMINTVGNPMETTLAVNRVIFSGMLDELPGLKLLWAHAGGYAPFAIGRMDHGWRVREECRTIPAPPSDYLKRMYYDTITHAPGAISYLVQTVGASQVLLGSDHPQDMKDHDPLATLDQVSLTGQQRHAIIGGNAQRLLMPVPAPAETTITGE